MSPLLLTSISDFFFPFVSSYNQFVEETSLLSDMSTYPLLQTRVANIGFTVDKVVYRGYHATDQMQVFTIFN